MTADEAVAGRGSEEELLPCPICFKTCSSRLDLDAHMDTHPDTALRYRLNPSLFPLHLSSARFLSFPLPFLVSSFWLLSLIPPLLSCPHFLSLCTFTWLLFNFTLRHSVLIRPFKLRVYIKECVRESGRWSAGRGDEGGRETLGRERDVKKEDVPGTSVTMATQQGQSLT